MNKDYLYMQTAMLEAKKAYKKGEVPVGCVIVCEDKIIAKSHNKRHKQKDVFGHAEIEAIKKASKKLNSWVLDNCTIYVTLEPCLMCTGAILQSRIKRLVYATKEPKFGSVGSIINALDQPWNHQVEVISGVLAEEAKMILKSFFSELRKDKIQG